MEQLVHETIRNGYYVIVLYMDKLVLVRAVRCWYLVQSRPGFYLAYCTFVFYFL